MSVNDARVAVSLPSHPKTRKLIKRLGGEGAWHLVCLFLFASANRSDGDLIGMSDEDIEIAAGWSGDDEAFVKALVDVGFLDGAPGERKIHDWSDHNPWAAGAEARKERASYAALTKLYGSAGAAQRMPEYAARMQDARSSQAIGSDKSANSTAVSERRAKLSSANGSASSLPDAVNSTAPSPSPSPSPSPEDQELPEDKSSGPVVAAGELTADERKAILWRRWKEVSGDKGALLGRLCKAHGETEVLAAVEKVLAINPAEPKAYLTRMLVEAPKPDPLAEFMVGAI